MPPSDDQHFLSGKIFPDLNEDEQRTANEKEQQRNNNTLPVKKAAVWWESCITESATEKYEKQGKNGYDSE